MSFNLYKVSKMCKSIDRKLIGSCLGDVWQEAKEYGLLFWSEENDLKQTTEMTAQHCAYIKNH